MSLGPHQIAQWAIVSTTYNFHVKIYLYCVVMGKTEGFDEDWHGHVTALTVGPEFRRLGLAETLMERLEKNSEQSVTD